MHSFSMSRIKGTGGFGNYRTQIGDAGAYYKGNYIILKPKESYKTTRNISLDDEYFSSVGKYEMSVRYGQFLTAKHKEKDVWRGTVPSNTITFTINNCRKKRASRSS